MKTAQSYDRRTILLHWLSAALVLALWCAGQTIDWFPGGVPRVTVRSLHITFGLLLTGLLVWRLLWRRSGGVKLPPADPGVTGRLAVGVHQLLYALLAATAVIGIACVLIRGDNLFYLYKVPSIAPGNKALRHDAVEWHALAANSLLIVAGLHAAAALWHQFVRKDGVLRRMWPAKD